MKLSSREKALLLVGLAFVALTAYIFYFLMPLNARNTSINKELADAKQQVSVLSAEASATKKMQDELDSQAAALKEKSAAFLKSMDDAQILIYLKELTDGKVSDLSVHFNPQQNGAGQLLSQTVTMEFSASYDNMVAVVDGLYSGKFFNKIQVVNANYQPVLNVVPGGGAIAKPAAGAAADVLKVHVETYFYAIPPADGQKVSPALPPKQEQRTSSVFPTD